MIKKLRSCLVETEYRAQSRQKDVYYSFQNVVKVTKYIW
jgi:hypothetical protein